MFGRLWKRLEGLIFLDKHMVWYNLCFEINNLCKKCLLIIIYYYDILSPFKLLQIEFKLRKLIFLKHCSGFHEKLWF